MLTGKTFHTSGPLTRLSSLSVLNASSLGQGLSDRAFVPSTVGPDLVTVMTIFPGLLYSVRWTSQMKWDGGD